MLSSSYTNGALLFPLRYKQLLIFCCATDLIIYFFCLFQIKIQYQTRLLLFLTKKYSEIITLYSKHGILKTLNSCPMTTEHVDLKTMVARVYYISF